MYQGALQSSMVAAERRRERASIEAWSEIETMRVIGALRAPMRNETKKETNSSRTWKIKTRKQTSQVALSKRSKLALFSRSVSTDSHISAVDGGAVHLRREQLTEFARGSARVLHHKPRPIMRHSDPADDWLVEGEAEEWVKMVVSRQAAAEDG